MVGSEDKSRDHKTGSPDTRADPAKLGESSGNNVAQSTNERPSKRKKVHHACLYCRRSHMTCDLNRPCHRCLKRNIGHLCHDEISGPTTANQEGDISPNSPQIMQSSTRHEMSGVDLSTPSASMPPFTARTGLEMNVGPGVKLPSAFDMDGRTPLYMPQYVVPGQGLDPFSGVNAVEVTNEYNLLGDFLNTSLLDDGPVLDADGSLIPGSNLNDGMQSTLPASVGSNTKSARSPNAAAAPADTDNANADARDKFYLTAADPAGNDSAEERMNKLLQAKYDAGMLKPFNYVNGYARLNRYMEKHMKPASRLKILRQLEKFRPKFREAMQGLTDIQLVKVEMWFERSLMEYDRVFASMALPACCWRRTGEIFRGNKEMAELINVPIELFHDVSVL